jgi:hypothetical protein
LLTTILSSSWLGLQILQHIQALIVKISEFSEDGSGTQGILGLSS